MSRELRSSHIPVTPAKFGPSYEIIPNRASALYNQERYSIDKYLTNFERVTITAADEYNIHTLTFKIYGTHQYWWVVCLFNGIIDPTTELEAGREIRIPSLVQIQSYLSNDIFKKKRSDFVRL